MGYFSKVSSLIIPEVPNVKLKVCVFPEKCEGVDNIQLHPPWGAGIKTSIFWEKSIILLETWITNSFLSSHSPSLYLILHKSITHCSYFPTQPSRSLSWCHKKAKSDSRIYVCNWPFSFLCYKSKLLYLPQDLLLSSPLFLWLQFI